MHKTIALGIAGLFCFFAHAQKVNKRYTFQSQPGVTDQVSDFAELSDGTLMLVWTSAKTPANDSCFVRARKILKSGVSGPIVNLEAFAAKELPEIQVAPLSNGEFGISFVLSWAEEGKKLYFSRYDQSGTASLRRMVIDSVEKGNIPYHELAADKNGSYALSWIKGLERDAGECKLATYTNKNIRTGLSTAATAPMFRDLKMDYRFGKIALAWEIIRRPEPSAVVCRIFNSRSEALTEEIPASANNKDQFSNPQILVLSPNDFVFSYTAAPKIIARDSITGPQNDELNLLVDFINTGSKLTVSRKTVPSGGTKVNTLHLFSEKKKAVIAWTDYSGGLYSYTFNEGKKAADSASVIERMNNSLQYGTVVCRPTKNFRLLVFNTISSKSMVQESLSYAYFLWKEKKPKEKKVKEPKQKKEKKEKEKKDNAEKENGNGRG